MTDFDWRLWAWDQLTTDVPLTTLLPAAQMHGAGDLTGQPSVRPFLVVTFTSKVPELNDGETPVSHSQVLTVWVHDEPGSYSQIDSIIELVRAALIGDSARICVWTGDSGDLADDTYATITRNSTYRLVGGS
jgi:hypothetical protein